MFNLKMQKIINQRSSGLKEPGLGTDPSEEKIREELLDQIPRS